MGGGAFSSACPRAGPPPVGAAAAGGVAMGVVVRVVVVLVGGVSSVGAGAVPGADGGTPAGRPRLGLTAGAVDGSTAAGWQFSQC